MKRLILLLMLAGSICLAEPFTIFGQAGRPDPFPVGTLEADSIEVTESIKGDSAYASLDSIEVDHATGLETLATDSAFLWSPDSIANIDGELFIKDDGGLHFGDSTSGDQDIRIFTAHESDASAYWEMNDGLGLWYTDIGIQTAGMLRASYVYGVSYVQCGLANNMTISNAGLIDTDGTVTTITVDPNEDGQGSIYLGINGDNDLIYCPNGEAALTDTLITAGGDSLFTSGGLIWKFVQGP